MRIHEQVILRETGKGVEKQSCGGGEAKQSPTRELQSVNYTIELSQPKGKGLRLSHASTSNYGLRTEKGGRGR